jgi:hypothetical protein
MDNVVYWWARNGKKQTALNKIQHDLLIDEEAV